MKKLMTLIAIVLVFSAVSGMAVARDETDRKRDRAPNRNRKAQQVRSGAARFEKLFESFNLSEEKLARVKQIFDTRRQADANWKKENAGDFQEIREAMAQAKKDGDSAAMRAAGQRMRKLTASRKGGLENMFVQLSEILNKEQLAKVKGLLSPQKPGESNYLLRAQIFNAALAKLDLTDVQKAEIKKIQDAVNAVMEKARAAMKEAKTHEEKAEIMKGLSQTTTEAWDKIKAILGEELTAKLQQAAREIARKAQKQNDPFAGLNLTGEQRGKIAAIRRSVREKMQTAQGAEAKRAVITEMRKEIDGVLSDEQKARFKEQMSKRRKAYDQSKSKRRRAKAGT